MMIYYEITFNHVDVQKYIVWNRSVSKHRNAVLVFLNSEECYIFMSLKDRIIVDIFS